MALCHFNRSINNDPQTPSVLSTVRITYKHVRVYRQRKPPSHTHTPTRFLTAFVKNLTRSSSGQTLCVCHWKEPLSSRYFTYFVENKTEPSESRCNLLRLKTSINRKKKILLFRATILCTDGKWTIYRLLPNIREKNVDAIIEGEKEKSNNEL